MDAPDRPTASGPASELTAAAAALARVAHEGHRRKSSGVPYFTHLEAVAELVRAHGHGDELTVAAAYLHDLVEDRPAFTERMRAEMPASVCETVTVLSEVKLDAAGQWRSKAERFAGYRAQLAADTPAARRAAPISCADKIHNIRSTIEAERAGRGMLASFSTRPSEHARQLAALREVYEGRVNPSLLAAFDAAARELAVTLREWLPHRAVSIAATTLMGRRDARGRPALDAALRRMLEQPDDDARIVAVLADSLGVGRWTPAELSREGFSARVVRALDAVRARADETLSARAARSAEDRLATRALLSELLHLEPSTPPTADAETRRAIAILTESLARRSLWIVLDAESQGALQAMATLPVVRASHVTLAHRIHPAELDEAWIPGEATVGDAVELRAVREHADGRVQAVVVAVGGGERRPADGGVLHVTVSRAHDARSSDSNAVIREVAGSPRALPLRGRVSWVDR